MRGTQETAEGPVSERKERERRTLESRRILGMRVDCTHYAEAAEQIASLCDEEGSSSVCVATVHMVMEAFDDPDFQRIVNAADLVTSDGVPLVWALRALGLRHATRVYGPTLMPVVCALAAREGIPVGFYGGTESILTALQEALRSQLPGLEIAFVHAPPFRPLTPAEDAALVSAVEDSGARILFVGIGCPKQERWMWDHRDQLSCTMVGVGAAFDFIAGAKSQAPAWMQRAGLEWLFRLASEPRRLWRRYLYNNPRFVAAFAKQWWQERRAPAA